VPEAVWAYYLVPPPPALYVFSLRQVDEALQAGAVRAITARHLSIEW